ncbi:putative AC transposase [Folsomia candida]|uniref:Putative AC transposase n=1 Tax=Folsomia candida TaxID=158441 RepID=A0A226DQ09_FOLCA|nr:putative AC transposase [Folsomia candida]
MWGLVVVAVRHGGAPPSWAEARTAWPGISHHALREYYRLSRGYPSIRLGVEVSTGRTAGPAVPGSEHDDASRSSNESSPASNSVGDRESDFGNRRQRSEMYDHFFLTSNKTQYSCKYCLKPLYKNSDGVTSNMKRHMLSDHPSELQKSESLNSIKRPRNSSPSNRPELTQEILVNALTEFVLETDQAFSIVEEPSFRRLLDLLKPEIKIPGRTTIRSKISKRYQKEKQRIASKLHEIPGRLSFVLDCWTSSNQYAFQGIIVQGISKDWQLLSLPLDLTILHGSHTGENLATQFFKRLMLEKNIDFSVEDFRVRCLAHILNLVCQTALDSLRDISGTNIDDIDPASDGTMVPVLTKLDKCVAFVRASPQRREQFRSQCKIFGLEEKELLLDVRTRWNSTLLMMERAFEYQKPLECTLRMESKLIGWILTQEQWKMVHNMTCFLQPFKAMTELMSKQDFPTISFCSLVYSKIFLHLEKYRVDAKRKLKAIDPKTGRPFPTWVRIAAKEVHEKLDKYYPSSDGLAYVVGTVGFCSSAIEKYRSRIKSYWTSSYANEQEISSEPLDESDENDLFMQLHRRHNSNDEITRYLLQPTISPNALDTGALGWWKNHESDFPTLSKIARDFLTAAGAGVPVERLVSSGSTLLTPKRQKMSPSTIQECICTKGWIKANYQEIFKHDLCVAVANKMGGGE